MRLMACGSLLVRMQEAAFCTVHVSSIYNREFQLVNVAPQQLAPPMPGSLITPLDFRTILEGNLVECRTLGEGVGFIFTVR